MTNPNQYQNNAEFAVTPRNYTPASARPKVRLYFIGTRIMHGEGDDPKTPPMFHIAGRVYQMPPIGEFIEVDELVAKEIELRCRSFDGKNPEPIPGVTTSKQIADAVKAAYERGESLADVRSMVASHALQSLDQEVLLAELKRRGIPIPEAAIKTATVEPDEPQEDGELVEAPPEKPKRGRAKE